MGHLEGNKFDNGFSNFKGPIHRLLRRFAAGLYIFDEHDRSHNMTMRNIETNTIVWLTRGVHNERKRMYVNVNSRRS
jgi:hypothetical protein